MRGWLLTRWERLRASFWLVPTLMGTSAVALALLVLFLDQQFASRWLQEQGWAFSGGVSGARAVLQTIAGSMITLTGLVYSMTLVVLSLAASQFGPRLLRNVMRSTTNQVVLGTFLATFLYCLIVLSSIGESAGSDPVPHISVTCGVLLAVVSLGVLIRFIHEVAVSIQTDHMAAEVTSELLAVIDRLFPDPLDSDDAESGPESGESGLPANFAAEAAPFCAWSDGYLQFVDHDALLALAVQHDLVFRLLRKPGHYLACGSPLIQVWPGHRLTDELCGQLRAAFATGGRRTPSQDVEFCINQLVEIAGRALSPGVNDPFTAIACIDRLSSALCRLVQRKLPAVDRFDEQSRLRLTGLPTAFPPVLDAACSPLRQFARSSVPVTVRLLEALQTVAQFARRPEDRAAVHAHAKMIVRSAREVIVEPHDLSAIDERKTAIEQLRGKDSVSAT
jgi:uncharacterized membrane protein